MDGIRVVELAVWVAGPAAGGILADWGADVIKIEPPDGDPFRGMGGFAEVIDVAPPFDLDNRGKRSISLNLGTTDGAAIARRLVDGADVFVTNVRPRSLVRAGLDYDTVRHDNPRLVYAQVTGYGPGHDDTDRATFDVGAFWARAGIASLLTAPGAPLPLQRGGMGDHTAAAHAVAAISAALFHRERSGEGQLVNASLLRSGAYTIGWDLNTALRGGDMPAPYAREAFVNPLITCYRTKDERWLWLLMLQGDRHWPDFCRAVEHEHWLTDDRYRTLEDRATNATALVADIDHVLAQRTIDEWAAAFDRDDVWWAPVQSPQQVVADPLMEAAGAWVDVPTANGSQRMVATPVDFSGTPWAPQRPVPEFGQHTEEILLDLDYDWDAIIRLKDGGVIP